MNCSRASIIAIICICMFVSFVVVYHLERIQEYVMTSSQLQSVAKEVRNILTIDHEGSDGKAVPAGSIVHSYGFLKEAVTSDPENKITKVCNELNDSIDKNIMTSLSYSKVYLVKTDQNGNVVLKLVAYDKQQRPKLYGDDVVVIWAEKEKGDGRISGQVEDHKNGSYTGHVTVFWTGKTRLYFKLITPIENSCRRWKAIKRYGNSVFAQSLPKGILATYKKNSSQVVNTTNCGPIPWIHGFTNLCNFTTLNGGLSWYCGKPNDKDFNCSDIYSFSSYPLVKVSFDRRNLITDPGHGVFKESVTTDITTPCILRQPSVRCSARPAIMSWSEPLPSGFWLNSAWTPLHCRAGVNHTNEEYRKCLANKHLFLIGESTVRQYSQYIADQVMEIGKVDMKNGHGPEDTYHRSSPLSGHNISLWYYQHEMPFHSYPGTWIKNIIAVPDLISSIAEMSLDGRDVILFLYYNSHISAHPPSAYRDRIRLLSNALQSFLATKPQAKVLYKGFHVMIEDDKWFDARISQLLDDILREEFMTVMDRVTLLDTMSITVAHNSELLHPNGNAFLSQIHQFFSYIC